ncbi:hypothetical protein [Halomonas sp. H10-9-1]|uniref:restriction endonuclease subunit S n=1 Tax=Halomonas sp. H10-9-1 TaxID=2950871 RepID=UPI0032E0420C
MSFPKYPKYKDSGVEWLGEVPAHWVVGPLRWYATIQGGVAKGKSYSNDTPTVDLPYLRVANVQDGHVDLSSVNTVTVALSEVDRYRLQPGDVLMNEGGDNDKLGRGTVWEGDIADCLHQNHVFAIRPNQYLLPYWLSMFTRTSAARSYFYLYSKQSTNLASISSSNVMSCLLPLPPVGEQRQILGFLDRETARIDALVAEQQRLIELLKEKRQAVISHAVTKGLDPDVTMKDSGVEWLGKVPAHWEVGRVKNVASFITSGPRGWSDYLTESGEEIFVQSGDLDDHIGVNFENAKRIRSPMGAEGARTRINCGDVLVCITGANTGRVAVSDLPPVSAFINQHLSLVRLNQVNALPEFVGYALSSESIQSFFRVEQYGLKEGLSLSDVADAPLVLPPKYEQELVIKYLKDQTQRLDRLVIDAERSVELLQERRSALISAAVTGKIDVRGWQADQQSEQPEILMAAETRATYG